MSLTHVDIIVKRIILKYPTFHKTRLSVIAHLLLRETEAYWGDDGRLHVHGVADTNPIMSFMKKTPSLNPEETINVNLLASTLRTPLIFCIPDNLEASWKNAILDVVQASMTALQREKQILANILQPSEGWEDFFWHDLYVKFKAVQEKLTPQNDVVSKIAS